MGNAWVVDIISDLGEFKQYLLAGDSSAIKPKRDTMSDLAIGSQFWQTDKDIMSNFGTDLEWHAK